jgi:Arc/MetJ-type ribon-helix-helix transcriptional regulator
MTTKIAVSLPDELVELARASVARGEFASVSAYVANAIRRAHSGFTLRDVLDEIEAEVGPPSAEVGAWADRVLGLDQP